jgi:solute carrier family 8 (sodium/calcium exchanger)
VNVPTGDDDDSGDEPPNPDEEPPTPSCMDYIMHFLTLFWKIIFAFIPPTGEI